MSKVRKAVIPVAGFGTRLFPATMIVKKELFPIVDRAGTARPLIHYNVQEAVASGVEEVCLVVRPDDRRLFEAYFQGELPADLEAKIRGSAWAARALEETVELGRHVAYVEQRAQDGYGHAVQCARSWVGEEAFLLLVGDHAHMPDGETRCGRRLMEVHDRYGGTVSAVKRTSEALLHFFGTIAGTPVEGDPGVYRVTSITEKPEPAYARSHLRVPGVPEGEYLCWFGQHILSPGIFDALGYLIDNDLREGGEIQLTTAQDLLVRMEPDYHACEMTGERFDIGVPAAFVRSVWRLGGPVPR